MTISQHMEQEDTAEEELPNWLFDDEAPESYFMPVNTLRFTDELTVRRVYALGRTISTLFEQFELLYWTTGGTSLGIVRHGGLIPWDDDLDICIRQQDESRLVNLSTELEKVGLCLQRSQPYAWKLYSLVDSVPVKNINYSHRYPFCDIFVMRESRDWFELSDKSGRNAWPQESSVTDPNPHFSKLIGSESDNTRIFAYLKLTNFIQTPTF